MLYKIRNFGLIFKILLSNGLSGPELTAKTVTSQISQQTAEKMLKNSQNWWEMKKIDKMGPVCALIAQPFVVAFW